MKARSLGFTVALAVFVLDQLTKWIVTGPLRLQEAAQIRLLPIFNLTWVENYGISLGLFNAQTAVGRWMLVGGSLLPVFFALTFAVPPAVGPVVAAIWVLVAFLLTATAFSLFQVPYIALPAELTPGYDERTRLLTWRVVVLTFAILLFGAGGPALRDALSDPAIGYLVMGIASGVVIDT